MISEQLQKKIDSSIKLLRSVCGTEDIVEIAYSGGKDSDVILQLAKESGINYRAIYKCTTIDPPGTIKHVKDMGVEILMPKDGKTFFKLIEQKGFPSRFRRHCCSELKEYKVLDRSVIGVRREESKARADRYTEPTACRFYGSKKNHVEQVFPILEWTTQDVRDYILDRGIKCAPVYYDEQGNFHEDRRLGCMCCPLQSHRKWLDEFKCYPNMVKAYIRAGQKYLDTHPDSKMAICHKGDGYRYFYRHVFVQTKEQWDSITNNLFGEPDYKAEIEKYFNIKLI